LAFERAQREAETGVVLPPRQNVTGALRPSPPPELTLDVQGISCAGCVWLIERIFLQRPGAREHFRQRPVRVDAAALDAG